MPCTLDTQIIQAAIDAKARVWINHNNETGIWQYSVVLVDDPGFWMDAFPTEAEAVAYCTDNELEVMFSEFFRSGDLGRSCACIHRIRSKI